jgi:hypothetical protein
MRTSGSRGSRLAGAILIAAFAAIQSGMGHAQTVTDRGQLVRPAPGWGWPYGPAWMPYGGYWYSPCYPFASCAAYQQFQMLERRQERSEELAREQQPPPQTRNGFPLTRHRGEATTSSDADVQPDYRGSGQTREQYRESGDFLPEFAHGKVRPGR